MEDALVPSHTSAACTRSNCLNPCFNGRCTRTAQNLYKLHNRQVLILVLMEDALVPFSAAVRLCCILVLILVLMEDALVR